MKRISVLLILLVLTGSILTGCGCTRRGMEMDTMPSTEMTILPTNIPETTAPTRPATEPATEPTMEIVTDPSVAASEDGITDSITGNARSRIR